MTIVEFTDFECPYCGQLIPVLDQIVKAYPDKVRVIFKHYPLPMHAHAQLAHEASVAAGVQGQFWEMYHLLFANQDHLEEADLLRYAAQLGLNVDTFREALDAHTFGSLVAESVAEGKGLGVGATPTLFINGQKLVGAKSFDTLKEQVDQVLGASGAANGTPQTPAQNQLPREINMAQAPVRGAPTAPVTVVEFADFQCPYCASVQGTLNRLLMEYPTGVKLVFKSFPLSFHEDSMLAHRAALAAGAQGRFWEMHDAIFAGQRAMKRDDLIRMARGLGLDMGKFVADLDSDSLRATVEADRLEGARLGVEGTPTFFVDGKELEGAGTQARFEEMVDQGLLAKGIAPPARVPIPANAGPTKGRDGAPVTIVWYSDIASPLQVKAAQLIDQIVNANPGAVRVIFKNRPLEFHHDAYLAHEALMAADAQGKFWAMHDLLLAHQKALSATDLLGYASKLGLDSRKFSDDLNQRVYRARVEADLSEARRSNVFGVPVFFVNGERVDGVQDLRAFQTIIDGKLRSGQLAAAR